VSSLFKRIRTGAGKAAFEAEKLRRVSAVQSTIKSLKSDVDKAVYQVGYVAYGLYRQGQVNQPELEAACERLAALQAQIAAREREIEAIRTEAYVEPETVPQYGRLCPNGHGPIPLPNNFCQKCGARAVEIPPPTPAAVAFCQNCGVALTEGSRFCIDCGQPVVESAPPTRPDAVSPGACVHCGATLVPDSLFCSECGQPVTAAALAPSASPVAGEGAEDETLPSKPTTSSDEETAFAAPDSVPPPPPEPEAAPEVEAETVANADERPTENVPPFDELEEELPMIPGDEEAPQLEETEPTATEVPGSCPACNAPLLPEAIFCAECGHRVVEEPE
jgi:hypothetical protein